MKLFEVHNLSYSYPRSQAPALSQVSFTINQGEFLLLMGRSGSGKSTLARVLCRLAPDFYGGKVSGQVLFQGIALRLWSKQELPAAIGMVFQEPERQMLFSQVERDIAFGLENLGIVLPVMKRRVAEVMDFLDLNGLKHKNPLELSGGEKQKIALAGVLAMQAQVLILDEPTAQLDPLAAEELLNWLKKVNQEMGTTIILVEQRLDKAFPLLDRVLVLEQGSLVFAGSPTRQPGWALQHDYPLMPTIPSILAGSAGPEFPLTVKDGRVIMEQMREESGLASWAQRKAEGFRPGLNCSGEAEQLVQPPFIHAVQIPEVPASKVIRAEAPLLEIKGLAFNYTRRSEFIEDLNLKIFRGESVVLLGANGAGKSTLLRLITGLLQPRHGNIKTNLNQRREAPTNNFGSGIAYLPQAVEDFFLTETLEKDLRLGSCMGRAMESGSDWLELMGMKGYAGQDPRILSAGEKQRAALACLLAGDPDLLLLDEPTTGMDAEWKGKLVELLLNWCGEQGKTIISVTHDMEFASELASRVLFMHGGEILADEPAASAFAGNFFYTSQATRLFKGFDDSVYKQSQARKIINNME